ncbi:MAG: DUF6452 family protein [Bacteroidales bacterium]
MKCFSRIPVALLFVATLLASITASCDDVCETPTLTAIVAGTYTDTIQPPVSYTLTSPAVYGVGRDSMLAPVAGKWLMPLSLAADQVRFVVEDDGIKDTLAFYYSRSVEFVSEECGCIAVARIDSIVYSMHKLKRVEIVKPSVRTVYVDQDKRNDENIHLIY